MQQFIDTITTWLQIFAVIFIVVLGGRLMYQLSTRSCVETVPYEVGNSTLGASGTYCKTWKQN